MVPTRKTSSPVVKVKATTHSALQELSREEDRPMGEIIAYLVERYERERFWITAAADLERLRQDGDSWHDYRAESESLDRLANDGLENEPPFFTDQEEERIREEIAARS